MLGKALENVMICHTRSTKNMFDKLKDEFLTISELYEEFHKNVEKMKNFIHVLEFADGEMEVEVAKSLRGKDIYILTSFSRNSYNISVNEAKMEFFHTIDAIKRCGVNSITAFIPYYSSSRSDRLTRRNSVGFWIDYKIMMSLGVDRIITFQLHSKTSKTAVDPTMCLMDDIPVVPLLEEYLMKEHIKTIENLDNEVRQNWIFCSVDAGGKDLAKTYASCLGTDLVIAYKKRSYKQANKVEYVNILAEDEIKGKDMWISDDMIDTGGSIAVLMDELIKREVRSINIIISHPVFSKNAVDRFVKYYEMGILKTIITCETIEITEELRTKMPFLKVVPITKLIVDIIITLSKNDSLSPFLQDFTVDSYFKRSNE